MTDLIQRLRDYSRGDTDAMLDEAADALEAAKAEVERLNNKYEALRGVMRTYEQQQLAMAQADDEVIAALKAQAAKDTADAGRYRWLREYKLAHNGHCQSMVGPILWSKSLDEAVDIAMKESQA
jgi:multidrug efflux pump subunit AcrA (membrane-fusion protein)